jgi:26S proteasome regulatory subunit N9
MSTYVEATSGSAQHCEAMSSQFPELSAFYNQVAEYCQQKLWHQLTLAVLDFTSTPKTTLRPLLLDGDEKKISNTYLALYQKVVLAVSQKLNSLALARIAAAVAVCSLQQKGSVEESKTLLEELLSKQLQPPANATTLYLQSKIALLTLNHSSPTKEDLQSIYATIKTNAPLLKQSLIPDTPEAMIVNSFHYEMSMTYFKIVGPPEAFYEEAIQYLNYYQPSPDEEGAKLSHALAVDLCLAALTGDGVYNLGQVVTNPILQVLQTTPEAWLVQLLHACAKGSVPEFKKLCQETYPAQIASQPALVNMAQQMQEKMTLLALVEMVFERPASERTLDFSDIAQRLEIPLEQVEWVIMRAFSVKLMEGSMDQFDGTVHVTWILPRVLGKEQMADLATRFGEWAGKVGKTKEYMLEQTPTMTA